MAWEKIDENEPLNVGDKVRLHYKTVGLKWITAAQLAMIDKRLEGNSHFKVLRHSLPSGGQVNFEVEIIASNPIVVTISYISAAILGAAVIGLVSWMIFAGGERFQGAKDAIGSIISAAGAIGTAAALYFGLKFLKGVKGV